MYYLGIDPGVRKLGFALIDNNLNILQAGILIDERKKVSRSDYYKRMLDIIDFFEDLFREYKIHSLGIEKLFFTKFNQSNAEFVFGIRGALLILALKHNIRITEFTPIQLKKNITGNGKAEKILVQNYIKKIFNLKTLPEYDDAADAIGLAYLAKLQH